MHLLVAHGFNSMLSFLFHEHITTVDAHPHSIAIKKHDFLRMISSCWTQFNEQFPCIYCDKHKISPICSFSKSMTAEALRIMLPI